MDEGRRRFLHGLGGAALAAATCVWPRPARAAFRAGEAPETLAAELFRGLSPAQRSEIAFPWDHVDGERGLLRARVSANWQVTRPSLDSGFFSADQRALVRAIFEGIIDPGWHERYDRQLLDDAGGWGRHQSIGLFGEPGAPFQLVLTGRHMTLRAGSDPEPTVAFGVRGLSAGR